MTARKSGVVAHVTSLPGRYGVGDLGAAARDFIDFLARAGQQLWQVLPLGPTNTADWFSPYSGPSAFALDPLVLDLDALAARGLIDPEALAAARRPVRDRADLVEVEASRRALFDAASHRFHADASPDDRAAFARFCDDARDWLPDFALFTALRREHGPRWSAWPAPLRHRDPEALRAASIQLADAIATTRFEQFELARQWAALRAYANARGIEVIGDLPIYVSYDSADVWAHPGLFQLDPITLLSRFDAGAAPDAFSDAGQHWGNPVYDWPANAADDYRWWTARMRIAFTRFDHVRLDHFRGFEAYWAIPIGQPPATGRWEPGPGAALFESLTRQLGPLPLAVEDLGTITPAVHALRAAFGFPGMAVLEHGYDGAPDNPYHPAACRPDLIMYTSTHDMPTLVGWLATLPPDARAAVTRDAGGDDTASLLRLVWSTAARWALAPLQDVLGLGDDARMNVPGTVSAANWTWRVSAEALTDDLARELAQLTAATGRMRG